MNQQLLDQLYGHLTTFVAGVAAIAVAVLDLKTGMQLGETSDVVLLVAGFGALGLQVGGVLPR